MGRYQFFIFVCTSNSTVVIHCGRLTLHFAACCGPESGKSLYRPPVTVLYLGRLHVFLKNKVYRKEDLKHILGVNLNSKNETHFKSCPP